jgi:hypothetical protein
VKKVNKEAMGFDGYMTFTINKVTIVDNQSWIFVHGYVVKYWCWIPILLIVEHIIDGSNLDNLTQVLLHFFILMEGFP